MSSNNLCEVKSTGAFNFMHGKFVCSLPVGHDGSHRAYWNNNVTGLGKDVAWLGPWQDERPWEDEEAVRLEREWASRPCP